MSLMKQSEIRETARDVLTPDVYSVQQRIYPRAIASQIIKMLMFSKPQYARAMSIANSRANIGHVQMNSTVRMVVKAGRMASHIQVHL